MRPATKEERESVDRYIKSISHKTGLVYAAGDIDYEKDFEIDEIDFIAEHPKADMSNVNKIRINGKVYLAVEDVMRIVEYANQKAGDKTYIVMPYGRFYSQAQYIKEKVLELLEDR